MAVHLADALSSLSSLIAHISHESIANDTHNDNSIKSQQLALMTQFAHEQQGEAPIKSVGSINPSKKQKHCVAIHTYKQ